MMTEIIARLAPHAQAFGIHPATLLGLLVIALFAFIFVGLKALA